MPNKVQKMQKTIFKKRKSKISAIKTITFIMAFIPIVILVAIIISLLLNSRTAIHTGGWSLFSAKFDASSRLYGLLPAVWGTFLVILVAMIIAAPVSLFLAILANDFSIGFLGTAVRWALGVLSGIPSIIFAAMAPVFFASFIWPKFAGKGLTETALLKIAQYSTLPLNGSTLLGGILLSLLIIPFLSPLMDDAIKSVPHTFKEASFSLGADRWHTLINVTLPSAISGISSALMLGILTALGESVIVAFAIGFEADKIPVPLFDILKKTAPLTSSIVGFSAGGFSPIQNGTLLTSIGNFAGLILLVVAFVFLGISTYLQIRFKKRFIP
jgi:phosphate transport system permease protein